MAELFQEAYPVLDFLPKLCFGSAGLGVGYTLVAPEGLDVMRMAQPLAIGAPLRQYYVKPAPYDPTAYMSSRLECSAPKHLPLGISLGPARSSRKKPLWGFKKSPLKNRKIV